MTTTPRTAPDKETVRAQTDIVAVVRERVPDLAERQRGDFWACCPFHREDTPSFHVRRDQGDYKCFGCGEYGDVFTFVMKTRHVGFREALAALAGEAPYASQGEVNVPSGPRTTARKQRRWATDEEVEQTWRVTTYLSDDAEVCAALRERCLDPARIDERDTMARVLPPGAPCPSWARYRGRAWSECGYRIVIPLFDACGTYRAFRARAHDPKKKPKSVSACGLTTSGLVMGGRAGSWVMEHAEPVRDWPPSTPFSVWVAEGEVDMWSLACSPSLQDAHPAPVLLGVTCHSWNDELASRMPPGSEVHLCMDPDEPGERIARTIAESLQGRCDVFRQRFNGATP